MPADFTFEPLGKGEGRKDFCSGNPVLDLFLHELASQDIKRRLAVDERFTRRGLGAALIADAAIRASEAAPAIYALAVDAKDEAAASFYRHLGFQPFVSRPMSSYLPLSTAFAEKQRQ